MTGWLCTAEFVSPIADLREHDNDSVDCWCVPFFDGDILVHNSVDQREEFEDGRRKVS